MIHHLTRLSQSMMMTSRSPHLVALAALFLQRPAEVRLLIEKCGGPEPLFHSKNFSLMQELALNPAIMTLISQSADLKAAEEILRKCENRGIQLVSIWDEVYPARLKAISDPPILLYLQGNIASLSDSSVAIVGSRKASDYGLRLTRLLVKGLCEQHVTITSGLAFGIDVAAHEAAMSCGSKTIAVLGGGLDCLSPKSHQAIANKIIQNGCLVSEFPPDQPALGWQFLFRNRIISGLSMGVCVVEAARRSGSLSTARHALEQGRDVFAVPGDVGRETSIGPHMLLKEGAILAESATDILQGLALETIHKPPSKGLQLPLIEECSPLERGILSQLSEVPQLIDTLSQGLSESPQAILAALTTLLSKGLVEIFPGQKYGRIR